MATIAIGISKKPSGEYTCEVPVNALAEDGVPPEEGDTVNYSVEGKVQSVSANTATVSIDTINGEPVGEEAEESPEEEAGEEGSENSSGGGGNPGGGANPGPANPGPKAGGLGALAPMGGGLTGTPPPPLRSRLNRSGTNAMRAALMKGARGRALPF